MSQPAIDLEHLARRESEQTEWKENVADCDDVVRCLSAFANDLANLGGGYVVCGAIEEKDAHGFPKLRRVGLTANRLKEVEGIVMTRCRERVFPAITPLVEELPADTPDGRILVFIQPATSQTHQFRDGTSSGKYYVRLSRQTVEARNGPLRELMVRKGTMEPWDRRPCPGATTADLDLVALRDTLSRMGMMEADGDVAAYLSDSLQISRRCASGSRLPGHCGPETSPFCSLAATSLASFRVRLPCFRSITAATARLPLRNATKWTATSWSRPRFWRPYWTCRLGNGSIRTHLANPIFSAIPSERSMRPVATLWPIATTNSRTL